MPHRTSGSIIGWRIASGLILLSALGLGIWGIGRSLWLDEAWVANSVLEPSLRGMFYYPEWVQSTPPLFLLFLRAAVHIAGPSNAAFRMVPLVFSMLGISCMLALARRVLSLPFAVLACSLLAFHPTVIEYSHTAKQYSAELAASAAILLATVLYLERPSPRRFAWLMGLFVLALPAAWSTVFLLPGVAIALWARGGLRRAAFLVLIFGSLLAVLYFAVIRQNVSPQLREFWTATAQKPSVGLLAALVFCIAAAARAAYKRIWIQIAALLPCLLFSGADLLHLYPGEPRTRLFALPCFLLASAMVAQELWTRQLDRLPRGRWIGQLADVAILIAAVAIGSQAIWRQIRLNPDRPQEDFQAAVQDLRKIVTPNDLFLVHASVREGFRLYAAMDGWQDTHAIFGETGFPCCARNKVATPNSSNAAAVYADIDRMVPSGFTGRVWLFYSARHTHWVYIGNDEGILWRNHLWERGCPPGPYLNLQNLVICAMDCAHAK